MEVLLKSIAEQCTGCERVLRQKGNKWTHRLIGYFLHWTENCTFLHVFSLDFSQLAWCLYTDENPYNVYQIYFTTSSKDVVV